MTVKGRVTPRWGRDRSARWDPGPTHRMRSYPARSQPTAPVPETSKRAELPGRLGAAERLLALNYAQVPADPSTFTLEVVTDGWYRDVVTLDERQARFLRDTLNAWFPD